MAGHPCFLTLRALHSPQLAPGSVTTVVTGSFCCFELGEGLPGQLCGTPTSCCPQFRGWGAGAQAWGGPALPCKPHPTLSGLRLDSVLTPCAASSGLGQGPPFRSSLGICHRVAVTLELACGVCCLHEPITWTTPFHIRDAVTPPSPGPDPDMRSLSPSSGPGPLPWRELIQWLPCLGVSQQQAESLC